MVGCGVGSGTAVGSGVGGSVGGSVGGIVGVGVDVGKALTWDEPEVAVVVFWSPGEAVGEGGADPLFPEEAVVVAAA